METIFTKIGAGIIPSTKIYEDEVCFAILDIRPIKKGHSLVIAREPYKNTNECPEDILCHMMSVVKKIETKMREVLHTNGSNIVINNDPASGQEVPHLHIHIVPRYNKDERQVFDTSDAGHEKYEENEMATFGQMLKI
ncbi:MAG: HIT family protein [Sphaerochaetaceae bacterium]|nr:HIT family protein [Sphaerochaetaceae bacterium]